MTDTENGEKNSSLPHVSKTAIHNNKLKTDVNKHDQTEVIKLRLLSSCKTQICISSFSLLSVSFHLLMLKEMSLNYSVV